MTEQHANDAPVPEEDDKILDENNDLLLTYL